jgi:general secretion pathway protein B
MSYILDALRKSEQQRQATKPDSVTDRLLINPPQPNQKPVKWIVALVFGNVLVIAYLVWYFNQKTTGELKPAAEHQQTQQILPSKPNKVLLPPSSVQNKSSQKTGQLAGVSPTQKPPSPSIAELIEATKSVDKPQPIKKIPEKKPIIAKKDLIDRSEQIPTIQPEPSNLIPEEASPSPRVKGMPALDDLPYEIRNNLPNLTINVFSYDLQPEGRFVIIDMVKYKTGQLIKGSVILQEIRPDSIILQYRSTTFRVDRP